MVTCYLNNISSLYRTMLIKGTVREIVTVDSAELADIVFI